jgi:SAM-dependent methyltransferase
MTARWPAGVGRMVRFNWPDYALASAAVPALSAAARWRGLGIVPRIAAAAGAGLAAWWTGASLVAGWWIYDRSALYRWTWVTSLLPAVPRRWANITAGFDESTDVLRSLLGSDGTAIDLFDPVRMTEASIHRARAARPPAEGTVPGTPARLPLGDASLDAAFVIFAAHELRERGDRAALFAELARVVRVGGSVVVVEHPRNAANLLAFGPGAFHFFVTAEWQTLARSAGFELHGRRSMTPFVGALVLSRP